MSSGSIIQVMFKAYQNSNAALYDTKILVSDIKNAPVLTSQNGSASLWEDGITRLWAGDQFRLLTDC